MNKIPTLIIVMGFIFLGVFVFKITSYDVTSVVATKPTPTQVVEPIPTKVPLSAEKLEAIVNTWRVSQSLQALIHSENMCRIADIRLPEIERNWSHYGFSADRFCTELCTIGENLARGFSTEQETLNGWLASPNHLAELKTPYTHTCIKTNQRFTIQVFGYF